MVRPVIGSSSATSSDRSAVAFSLAGAPFSRLSDSNSLPTDSTTQADVRFADLISSAVSGNSIVIVVVPAPVTSFASNKDTAAIASGLKATDLLEEAAVTGETVLVIPRTTLR